MESKDLQKKMDCCFEYVFRKVLSLQFNLNACMKHELTKKEIITITEPKSTLSHKELKDKCYSLKESKRLLVQSVHSHYHQF